MLTNKRVAVKQVFRRVLTVLLIAVGLSVVAVVGPNAAKADGYDCSGGLYVPVMNGGSRVAAVGVVANSVGSPTIVYVCVEGPTNGVEIGLGLYSTTGAIVQVVTCPIGGPCSNTGSNGATYTLPALNPGQSKGFEGLGACAYVVGQQQLPTCSTGISATATPTGTGPTPGTSPGLCVLNTGGPPCEVYIPAVWVQPGSVATIALSLPVVGSVTRPVGTEECISIGTASCP